MSNELTHGACAIFKSPIHGNRPVVFAGAGYEKKAQLFDYTIANTWEESKHDFSLIKSLGIYGIQPAIKYQSKTKLGCPKNGGRSLICKSI